MSEMSEPLASRCNNEPNIFKGCSSSELMVLAIVSVLCWFPIGIIAWLLSGSFPAGAATAVLGVLATVFIAPGIFQRVKRGRPDGYYQIAINILLGRFAILRTLGLVTNDYIRVSGQWDIGRTQE